MTPTRAAPASPIQGSDIDHAVVAALAAHGINQPKIMTRIDLTTPFAASSSWTLVIAQDPTPRPPVIADFNEHGPLALCFVHDLAPDCSDKLYEQVGSDDRLLSGTPFDLLDARVVYAARDGGRPMLLLKTCGPLSANGACMVATALYGYDRRADRFYKAFGNVASSKNNRATRYVESGPLLGAMIVDYPTDKAPYTYWIEVYRLGNSTRYRRVLRYRGTTGYGDGNELAVSDSEMPEILRRLGLWTSSDALPVPPDGSEECDHPIMLKREEWCR